MLGVTVSHTKFMNGRSVTKPNEHTASISCSMIRMYCLKIAV